VGLDGMHIIYPADAAAIAAVQEAVPPAFTPRLGIGPGKFPAYLAAIQNTTAMVTNEQAQNLAAQYSIAL
jgi:tRNA A58 N-methylase Trm61